MCIRDSFTELYNLIDNVPYIIYMTLIALMVDEVGKCLVDTEDEVHARIEGINDCFDALNELED